LNHRSWQFHLGSAVGIGFRASPHEQGGEA
jgi:hypothetical protein